MVWSTTRIVDSGILTELSNDKEDTGKCFFRTSCTSMCCWLFVKGASVLSFEQNKLVAKLEIENLYRFPSGLTNGEGFQRLSGGEFFYGTPLQGQDF